MKYLVDMNDFHGGITVIVHADNEAQAKLRAEQYYPGWLAVAAEKEEEGENK